MDSSPSLSVAAPAATGRRWWTHWQLWMLVALVAFMYLPRLTERPMRGEDSRRATIANEMFDTKDWIVPRQQHVPYLSRPPLHSWVMAGLSLVTGNVDYWAIRLPSVFGVLGMVVVVYAVSQLFVGRTAALVGGAAMASMPQVLELGRFGETDAMFSCLVSSSLLIWLAGYYRGWPKGLVWSLGYGIAALGTLTKGIQALPYFAGGTWLFLAWRRDWRWLLCRGHLLGIGVFAVVFGAWAVPFVKALGFPALIEIFRKDSRDQMGFTGIGGYLKQLGTMPLRVAGSLMPWAFLFLLFLLPAVRRFAGTVRTATMFLGVALLVAWPTVWLSPTTQNRHFMPLYPCLAVLVAIVAGAVLREPPESRAVKGWRAYMGVLNVVMIAAGVALAALALPVTITLLKRTSAKVPWADMQLSPVMGVVFLAGALVLGAMAWLASRRVNEKRMTMGALAVAGFMGLLMVGPVQSLDAARAIDIRPDVAKLKQIVGQKTLVSYGPTAHLFAYYYRDYIPIVPRPASASDPGAKVEYFCFSAGQEVLPDCKLKGDLPFRWEKVGEYCCDRTKSDAPKVLIVVGRRLDP